MRIAKSPITYLFALFMLDFALTFYGINILGVIEEANPVWIAVFNLPLGWSTLVRVLYFCLIVFPPCEYVRRKKPLYFKWLMVIAFVAFGGVMLMHAYWLLSPWLMDIIYPI